MKKQTGIWLDLRHAYIIELPEQGLPDAATAVKQLSSEIEESAATGGTRSKTPWGPQGGDTHRSAQERRHHEEDHYFDAIIAQIEPHQPDELVIFGPSEAKHGLANALEQHKAFHPKVVGVESADRMTEPQMVQWVSSYFGRPARRRLPKRN